MDETPHQAIERASDLRVQADKLEYDAIRAALVQTRGMVRDAAKLLGLSRDTLHTLLRRRYTDLAVEARAMRAAAGYRGGNPALIKRSQL